MIQSKHIQKSRQILVVDDQRINREILGIILEDDYDVIFAENGKVALEVMRQNIDSISLVMLDLIMPVMDGFAVLDVMHADEKLNHIPVIVLTAEKTAELNALQLGAADFITKPFDVHDVIIARVKRVIDLSEGRHLIASAERDQLTDLYSRNFFFEYAYRLFTYHSDLHLDAVVMNIEQFHSLNALSGRDFGDEVLRTIGDEIRTFLAESQGIASRLEADRFYIYCIEQEDYAAMLARFQNKVNEISPNVRIHLRMGVKPWQEGIEPIVLFDQAHAACNMVRGDYQRPLMIYDEDMRLRELFNQQLLNDLRTAVDEHQLKVYYQPKYNIQNDPPTLSSAEALVRWNHPELGMVSPGSFIPLFEGNGLISIVDTYVWNEAAAQVAKWKEKFGFELPVSVNLSRADVFDLSLVDRLHKLVESYGLDYKSVKLELTETAYTQDAKQLVDVISDLRDKGFDVEMDDFGSGYSSLNMLSEMPLDVLKIDMKFIRNIETNETDRRLVNLTLDLAKFLKVTVVAEGVETEGQLELLREAGCDIVQGYYFSPPLPPEKFEKLIEREIIDRKEQTT